MPLRVAKLWPALEKRIGRSVTARRETDAVGAGPIIGRGAYDPFLLLLKAHGLPLPATEVVFHPVRKWRADYLWREPRKVIVEKEGGIWSKNEQAQRAHAKPLKILRDMEKGNEAQRLGYLYLRFTPDQLERGDALPVLREVLC